MYNHVYAPYTHAIICGESCQSQDMFPCIKSHDDEHRNKNYETIIRILNPVTFLFMRLSSSGFKQPPTSL